LAVQNYKERVVYPSGSLIATPEQFAMLIMGDVGFDVILDFNVGDKLITDEGVVVRRKDENLYTLCGHATKAEVNTLFNEQLPVDLSAMLYNIAEENLGSITLVH